MYGNAYFEWRQAEDAMIRLERDLESLEPGARAIMEGKLRKRYRVPDQTEALLQQPAPTYPGGLHPLFGSVLG